ncbi:hypothetical protein LOAG_00144 [Loa loa]|uniref:Uncharacterized protein n=1 Tax=Loa loa TaxID=7209 RepID=A0A1S0UBU6_LOALO|nr:hypothetical protein LOAG_00144 [Loa loa]EFO28325.1 hypothetical protein LOAG_00144 [Loa loa]
MVTLEKFAVTLKENRNTRGGHNCGTDGPFSRRKEGLTSFFNGHYQCVQPTEVRHLPPVCQFANKCVVIREFQTMKRTKETGRMINSLTSRSRMLAQTKTYVVKSTSRFGIR